MRCRDRSRLAVERAAAHADFGDRAVECGRHVCIRLGRRQCRAGRGKLVKPLLEARDQFGDLVGFLTVAFWRVGSRPAARDLVHATREIVEPQMHLRVVCG